MRRLTKNMGHSDLVRKNDSTVKVDIKRILICRPNHRLGNLLLITPLLQDVIATFPHCKIDLFVKGNLAPILFENYENIEDIIQLPRKHFKHLIKYFQGWLFIKRKHYDITVNAVRSSSSGRLSTQFARSEYKFFGEGDEDIQLKHADYEHTAKYPVYAFRDYLTKMGFPENDKPVPSLNLRLSTLEIEQGQKILRDLVNNERETICLYTYATGDKCFSESWWTGLYERLKAAYPDYNILEVLPIENISKISFKALSFYSRDIREIGSLIANTKVFVGADSGIMHLASSVHTPTIGLFSVTDHNSYQPYNNNSMSIKVINNDTDACVRAVNEILVSKHNLQ